jgi:DNA-binding response OmpR family regulator
MDARNVEPRERRQPAGPFPCRRPNLLLMADRDRDTHAVYGAFLESRGFALVHAYSPAECVALARSSGCGAVVASVGRRGLLPWDSFHELARSASAAGIPIVCLTTDPYVAAHWRVLVPEAARVLMLPCEPRKLAAALARALRRPAGPSQLH